MVLGGGGRAPTPVRKWIHQLYQREAEETVHWVLCTPDDSLYPPFFQGSCRVAVRVSIVFLDDPIVQPGRQFLANEPGFCKLLQAAVSKLVPRSTHTCTITNHLCLWVVVFLPQPFAQYGRGCNLHKLQIFRTLFPQQLPEEPTARTPKTNPLCFKRMVKMFTF